MSDLLSNILSFSPQTAPRLVSDAEYDEQIRNHFAHLTQILPARFAGGYAEALDLLQVRRWITSELGRLSITINVLL